MQNNFKYIDDMIRNGQREIILDSNIILDDGEESEYLEGIEVDLDFIVIDGCGHTIDARGKARIFNCIARRITLKNITFKNGQSFNNHDDSQNDHGGAIKINPGCTIRIVNCQFTGNASQNKAGAIFNLGEAEIDKSSFTENSSQKYGGAILNAGEMFLFECNFSSNYAFFEAGALKNTGQMKIDYCTFYENRTDQKGGAIVNHGEMMLKRSEISRNYAKFRCGGIITRSSKATIFQSKINENRSDGYGNAILASKNLKIESCELCENVALNLGSTIYAWECDLEISYTKILNNRSFKVISTIESDLALSYSTIKENDGDIELDGKAKICHCIMSDTWPEKEIDTTGNH